MAFIEVLYGGFVLLIMALGNRSGPIYYNIEFALQFVGYQDV